MKTTTPHDPFDDLIAAALHGELTPEERTQFDARLSNDPAAHAAYQKAQLMHDLLEKNHQNAQPDPAFEQRMVSGVRRKIQNEQHRETAWESALVLWRALTSFSKKPRWVQITVALAIVAILAGLFFPAGTASLNAAKRARMLAYNGIADPSSTLDFEQTSADKRDLRRVIQQQGINYTTTAQKGITLSGYVDNGYTQHFAGAGQAAPIIDSSSTLSTGGLRTLHAGEGTMVLQGGNAYTGGTVINGGSLSLGQVPTVTTRNGYTTTPPASSVAFGNTSANATTVDANAAPMPDVTTTPTASPQAPPTTPPAQTLAYDATAAKAPADGPDAQGLVEEAKDAQKQAQSQDLASLESQKKTLPKPAVLPELPSVAAQSANAAASAPGTASQPSVVTAAPAIDTRKLIRNAQLDLEVKSYQTAMDAITALTKAASGYVDTSSSQKGGNGKLQGTVVVKVLPQNLDSFLLKLRDLGELQNQSVSTDDVTKDYFDTQARLDNSRRMEAQLQDLLKRTNGRVSDLLQVERELGRVRGDIEQMQGQLKLYDFQVQYATVTMNMREKDLNQSAAYLLKEQDQFSLFASDVEGTFQQARKTADDFKAQILAANLNHESGNNVSADLTIMVAPDQIEAFLSQLRGLGRVANFTRQTQRVAKDGGDSDQPADETLTEKDKVQVEISIRSDDESRKQVAMTVVTPSVDTALDQAKAAALTNAGAEILSSSLNKTTQGESTAQLSVRVPGKNFQALLNSYRALGRTASFSLQRDDNSGPGASGDDAPVILSLSLTDTDTPLQVAELSVLATDVDNQAQQLKKVASDAGVQVTGSNFQRDPNGMEIAQMTFRLPMSKYPAFVETLKQLGHVESFTVQREDRPDQTRSDDTAPVEIGLRMHNQGDIVADNTGLWATLRQTFGEGAGALFGSVRVIGVLLAFSVPWIFAIGLIAWIGRRIYIWKKK